MNKKWLANQSELCAGAAQLNLKYAPQVANAAFDADGIIAALNQFQECVRYLNTRRSTGAVLKLDSEAEVQDAVYLMLRPWIHDLLSEDPTGKVGNRYSIKDFISPSAETVIEIKYVRDAKHGKDISSEMHDDIENYRHHPKCATLIFFVYDADSKIPNQEQLRLQIETARNYNGIPLRCVLIIKP
jgi:REase_DpnII-MboI